MQKLHALLLIIFLNSNSCKMKINEETIEKWKADGNTIENKGVFHTVRKRQTDVIWKFVWD